MNRVLDEIEGAFEMMLKNSPGLQNTQKAST
jgi:hypothetical protein